jgi:hypothetical protein
MTIGIYLTSSRLKGAMRLVYTIKQTIGRHHKVRVGRQDGFWYVGI